ncbi:MAG: RagB/SusD family nutrient uptake outer membrane protein, partial [Bacteroidales bacterium]|nr:RagB/SusD family nutrient uptake outer membrane protein [Bacteroidales bacterium]
AVFSNYRNARSYLDKCLVLLHCNHQARGSQSPTNSFINDASNAGDYLAYISDEACYNQAGGVTSGQWYGVSNLKEFGESTNHVGQPRAMLIPNAFYAIRVANKTLENVPEMENLTVTEYNELIGQAYFFRAWYYFQVIRRWGGFPILDRTYTTDDDFDLPRKSYQESTDWMLADIDSAIKYLPPDWSEEQKGRPDKASAHAIKGWVTLYAASPLMNNPIGVIEDNGYNQKYLVDAAKYCHEAITYVRSIGRDMAGLELTANGLENADMNAVAANYENIFYHDKSTGQLISEDALFYANTTGQNRDGDNRHIGARCDLGRTYLNKRFSYRFREYGAQFSSPNQNIVDKYETANGYPVQFINNQWITNDTSFNPNKPFDNRDPRFKNNILYPGAPRSVPSSGPSWFEPWLGGADYEVPGAENEAVGGYMCVKWWWDGYTKATAGTHCYNRNYVRASQLYLDYAEAMNEAYGPNVDPQGYGLTAVQAINLVRRRAGMVPVRNEFTTDAITFRERIRNERAVELFWEGHRWFDIRRWMIFDEVFKGINPIRILRTTDVTNYAGLGVNPNDVNGLDKNLEFRVEECTYEPRNYTKKHYWYPIFKSQMDRLSVMEQNPGW